MVSRQGNLIDEVQWMFYESLLYEDLSDVLHFSRVYWERSCSWPKLWLGYRIINNWLEWWPSRSIVWCKDIPSLLCTRTFLNGVEYLSRDYVVETETESIQELQKKNVELYQTCTLNKRLKFIWHCILPQMVLWNISYEEELCIDYGSSNNRTTLWMFYVSVLNRLCVWCYIGGFAVMCLWEHYFFCDQDKELGAYWKVNVKNMSKWSGLHIRKEDDCNMVRTIRYRTVIDLRRY